MIKTFKTRLIVLSVLVSGAALVSFAAGAWWLIRGIQFERLDAEVRAHAEREVGHQRTPQGWQRFEQDVMHTLGTRNPDDLLVLVQDAAGGRVYQSSKWPSAFASDRLPWPSQHDVPRSMLWMELLRPPPPDGPRESPREEPWQLPKGSPTDGLTGTPPPGPRPASSVIFREIEGQTWRMGLASTERTRVLIAVNARLMDAEMTSVRNAFWVAIPFALLLVGVGAWVLSSRAMRPLKKLTAATQRITVKGLDQRLSSVGKDQEFAELIAVFNGMLERLERSFKQASRFSADAAHELKTPLAIVQGQLERAIQQAEHQPGQQQALSDTLDEVRRLSGISRKLLLLSQADAGCMRVFKELFDLGAALQDVLEDCQMLAPHLKITQAIDTGLWVQADASLMRQVLHNLTSNAIKYNLDPGWMHVTARRQHTNVEVNVANASHGLADADVAKLFERFYRADNARNREVDGVGLGLSLSREIARSHGGELRLKAQNSEQVVFELTLPLA